MSRSVEISVPGLLIVHEKTRRWTSDLRTIAPELKPVRIRSLRVFAERIAQFPASFALVECELGQAGTLPTILARFRERFPLFRFAALCPELPGLPPETADTWMKLLTEAGAVHISGTTREIFPLVPILRNYLNALPLRETTLRETFRNRIPWK